MSTLYLLDTHVLAELQQGEAHADRDVRLAVPFGQ